MFLSSPLAAAAESAPSAAGAPMDQVLIVAAFTALVYGAVLWVILRERAGRTTLLGRAADAVARIEGGPRWFALPALISVTGALAAATGVYWDVSLHITKGRDEGPLANPAHYFIFLGLMLIFVGGALGMALRDERMPRRTLRLTTRWQAPMGATLGAAVAMLALLGFPLDDLWHRAFGQDVTEWGPTHVIMIGGTIMLPYSLLLTVSEARQVGGSKTAWLWEYIGVLVLMIGPVAFLLEYAFGVSQFPLINDVVIVTIAATIGYMYALYKGWAYVVATFVGYAVIQAALVATNTYVWDAMTPKQPALIGGAIAAVVLARWARPTVGFAAGAGIAVALANLVTEYYWTGFHRPMEWPAHLMGWAALFAIVTGVAVGLIGTWMHRTLESVAAPDTDPDADPGNDTGTGTRGLALMAPVGGAAAALGLLAMVAVFVVNVPPRTEGVGAVDVTLGEIDDGFATLDVRLDPDLVEDAYWFEAMAWQGDGFVRSEFDEIEPGLYRSQEPLPLEGTWKTLVRIQLPLHTQVSAPVYMPADPAVPVPAYDAASGPRDFIEEKLILQRELRDDAPVWWWSVAYVIVALVFAGLFAAVALAYSVAGRPGRGEFAPSLRRPRDLVGSD